MPKRDRVEKGPLVSEVKKNVAVSLQDFCSNV